MFRLAEALYSNPRTSNPPIPTISVRPHLGAGRSTARVSLMATRSLAWLLAAVLLLTVESAPDHASTGKSNLRDFYIMLAGIGPTQDGGGSVTDPASMWLRNTTWSSRYVTMSADWMVNASQISAARAVGWSITSTVHGSPRWCNRSSRGENLTHAMQMLTTGY